jgi:flagella basal body P-ring formation protein FlgA
MVMAALHLLLLCVLPIRGDTTITAGEIQRAIEAYVAQYSGIPLKDMMIEYRGIPDAMTLQEQNVQLRITPSSPPILKGNVILPIEIVSPTRTLKRIIVSLKIRTFEHVLFAKRKIERHREVTSEDIAVQRVETTYLPKNVITSEEQFAALRTCRVIFPGRPLTEDMFELLPAIEQGNDVVIVIIVNHVILKARGKAAQSGGIGDIISVTNAASGERFKAKILDAQTVEVIEH